jgi:redox-sensitive bicupin YhaK (pirin superfamily)
MHELPTFDEHGVHARLIAGEAHGLKAAVKGQSPLFYLHFECQRRARVSVPANYPERAIYVAAGVIEIAGKRFDSGQMLVVTPGSAVSFTAEEPAVVMALGGESVGPRFIEWNFVSSSRERIEQAKADWRAGRMKLPDLDNQEWIPLPPGASPPPEPMS